MELCHVVSYEQDAIEDVLKTEYGPVRDWWTSSSELKFCGGANSSSEGLGTSLVGTSMARNFEVQHVYRFEHCVMNISELHTSN
jgi:hypothetical protein